jgi:hypothetical protein
MSDLLLSFEDIKAEAFFASLKDSISDMGLEFQGVFTRNYLNDISDCDVYTVSDNNKYDFWLSRDGLFHTLPEGLFFDENLLSKIDKEKNREKFKATSEKIQKEKDKIRLFFQPFDKTYFSLRFELEKKLNEIAKNKTQLLINELFDIYNIKNDNQLINRIKPLLLLASEIRGNRMIMRDILKNLFFPAKVDVRIADKFISSGNSRKCFKVTVHIEKLSNEKYRSIKKDLDKFVQFFYEWFLPADMGYEFKIKDIKETFVLGKDLTLDYNTYFNGNTD